MSKKAPDCQYAKQGRARCQIDLPKPNQLCQVCRPFWAKSKIKPSKGKPA